MAPFLSLIAVRRAVPAVLLAGLLLAGCKDLGPRDYYILGKGPASQPATEAPQPMAPAAPAAPAEITAPPAPAPVEAQPAAPAPAVRPVVGLLLPLSGPNAVLGRVLFDAATLAQFDIGDDALTILPRDTGGTPEGAGAAAQSVIEAGARLIVGPLFAAEVPAVAAVARPAGVNIISLSNDRTVAGAGVFVMGLAPQGQIERLIGFARARGLKSYAALLPNNPFGAAIEQTLRQTAATAGGQVALVERYDPGAGDATPVVRRLAAYEANHTTISPGPPNDAASPVPAGGGDAFDSVLLPDFGDRLLSIAPLLPYYDVDPGRVRFLGSAFWEDPRITREPALIGAWFPAPPPTARFEFLRRFHQVYGRDPPRITTLIYDAMALAAVLARSAGGPDFSAAALSNPNGFAGADGIFRFRSDGTAERGLAVLEVRRDGFRVISPAPVDFRELTR